jgi:hypothetical protein
VQEFSAVLMSIRVIGARGRWSDAPLQALCVMQWFPKGIYGSRQTERFSLRDRREA